MDPTKGLLDSRISRHALARRSSIGTPARPVPLLIPEPDVVVIEERISRYRDPLPGSAVLW